MKIFDFLNKEKREEKKLNSCITILEKKKLTSQDNRKYALESLMATGTEESIKGLLKRYEYIIDKTIDDLDEKEEIHNYLIEKGKISILPVKEFLLKSHNIHWPFKILFKLSEKEMISKEELIDILLEIIGEDEVVFNEFANIKRKEGLECLKNFSSPKITDKVLNIYKNADDDIKMLIIDVLEVQKDENTREIIVDLLKEEKESPRIPLHIISALERLGWKVAGARKDVEKFLPKGKYIDKEGLIKTREY